MGEPVMTPVRALTVTVLHRGQALSTAPLFPLHFGEVPHPDPWQRGHLVPFDCGCIGQFRGDGSTLLARIVCAPHWAARQALDRRHICPACRADALVHDAAGVRCTACHHVVRADRLD